MKIPKSSNNSPITIVPNILMTNITHSSKVSSSKLAEMEKKVFDYRPQLQHIKEKYGSLFYFDYVKQKTRMNLNKSYIAKKPEVQQIIKNETSRLLGSAVAADVDKQLKKNDSMSTAEHSGPIGTSNMLNAALSHSIPQFNSNDPRFRSTLILSCTGISFGNASSFTRGFQLHQFKEKEVLESTLTFFGRSADAATVMYASPYTIDSLQEIKKKIDSFVQAGTNTPVDKEKLYSLFNTVYASPHALSGEDYVDQLTITNFYFWKMLFPAFKEENIPHYVMLSQEKIVLSLLLQYHLTNETPIYKFLFDPHYHNLIEKYFADVTGAFARDYSIGSFLFWGVSSKDNMRFQLMREGNKLVNKERDFMLELTPNAIREAILSHKIYPGLLLTFVILSFYYGLILEGGHLQTTYLTQMKERYLSMMEELGDTASFSEVQDSVTDDYLIYRPHIGFIDAWGDRIAAQGLDMYLHQNPNNWKNIIDASKTIPFEEFMTVLMPVFYKQLCPPEEQKEELMSITRNEVEKFIGFDKKVPPLGYIQ